MGLRHTKQLVVLESGECLYQEPIAPRDAMLRNAAWNGKERQRVETHGASPCCQI
jgi:hypothetical protein